MTNESFDSSDPTLSRVFICWLKEKFKLLNLNNKAKLEIGMQIEPYRVCRRVNILRDYPDDKIKIYP